MKQDQIQYLQMIQEIIGRMSTISSVIKGFAITLIVAVITILNGDFFDESLKWIFLLPILSLLILDVYYFSTEKKYRLLYDKIRQDKQPVDFSMKLTEEINKNKTIFLECLISKCTLIFYIPIIVMYAITCFLVS